MRKVTLDSLEQELRIAICKLAEYDYIMGDIGIQTRPWKMMSGRYGLLDIRSARERWIIESSLIVALAVQWGIKDGAHSLENAECEEISEMVRHLRTFSERTEEIAHAFDLVSSGRSDEEATIASLGIHNRYVKTACLENPGDVPLHEI